MTLAHTNPCYIVTGGAGFVGSNVVAELLRRDPAARVVVVDPCMSGSFANVIEACERRGVAPFSGEWIAQAVGEIDWRSILGHLRPAAIFHLGAITDTTVLDERHMLSTNLGGFSAEKPGSLLLECALLGTRLVYASSAATYGSPPEMASRTPFPVTAAGKPNNIYGFSKWLMECEHHRLTAAHPAAHVVGLRYFNVFGPGESRKGKMASMAFQLAQQLLAGKCPRLFADGSQARDQVHVDDVVDCTIHAAGLRLRGTPVTPVTPVKPGIYNLGSGRATSFREIIGAVRTGLGLDEHTLPTDYFEMPASIRAFYQDWTCADMSLTQSGLGWSPRVNPADGIVSYSRHLRATHVSPTTP